MSENDSCKDGESRSGNKSKNKESLAHTILALESNIAKQNALQHIINGLRIMYARDAVVAALQNQNKAQELGNYSF